ncbi:hypothetical protein [Halorussus caseinilyticus]|nr:hypothetical protein [Halorussus sp. DT72]
MNRKSDSSDVGRRSVLKTLGAAGTVGGLGFFSTRTEAAGPTGKAVSPEDHEPPNPDVQVRRVDKSVKAVSARYPLLTLPEDTVLSYIDASGLSKQEKGEARRSLAELRRRFPVRKEKDGNTTWYTLATSNPSKTKEDAEHFSKAGRAFAKGTAGELRDGPSAAHKTGLHRAMTRDACNEMGIDSTDTDELASYADDPDNPNVELGVPDGIPHEQTVEEGLENALEEVLHHYGQYLDTDAFEVWESGDHSDDFGNLGGAPYAADWHVNNARYSSGSERNKYLGKATHYPSDMSVPLHTGMGWEQANLNVYYDVWSLSMEWSVDPMYWLHSEYEEYVSDNWTGGHYLKYEYGSDQCSDGYYCYYPINDVQQAIQDMATESGQYSYDVYHHILDEGRTDWTNWDADTKDYMKRITENCIDMAGLYIRGFLHEFR